MGGFGARARNALGGVAKGAAGGERGVRPEVWTTGGATWEPWCLQITSRRTSFGEPKISCRQLREAIFAMLNDAKVMGRSVLQSLSSRLICSFVRFRFWIAVRSLFSLLSCGPSKMPSWLVRFIACMYYSMLARSWVFQRSINLFEFDPKNFLQPSK